jgi:hypothetical protein
METRDLTAKLMAKTPKIVHNCEGWANTFGRFLSGWILGKLCGVAPMRAIHRSGYWRMTTRSPRRQFSA